MYNKVKISQIFKIVNWKAVNYIMDLLTTGMRDGVVITRLPWM